MPSCERLVAGFVIAAVIAWPLPGRAQLQNQQLQSFSVWKQQDNCARSAFRQFPDYTADANRQRERALSNCLRGGQYPPRQSLLPEAVPQQGSSMPQRARPPG